MMKTAFFAKMNKTDFITANIMPESMQAYLQSTNWETESGNPNFGSDYSNMQNDTVINAKTAPISVNEYNTYADIIGYNKGIALRTPTDTVDSTKGTYGCFEAILKSGGKQFLTTNGTAYPIVPVFWVSNDIFKNVKVEIRRGGGSRQKFLRRETAADFIRTMNGAISISEVSRAGTM